MTTPIVYGPAYSTYTRTVRLALEEKPAEYRLEQVDMLKGEAQESRHLARQPFGKVPAFEYDGATIYETNAIGRYVDRVLPGQRLQPDDARDASRMDQAIGIVDSYAYGAIIGKIFWQRAVVPMMGGQPDDQAVSGAKPMAKRCLAEFERILGGGPYLAGPRLSLADLYLAPVLAYLAMTPEAGELLGPHRKLKEWWRSMDSRPAMEKTRPNLG